MGAVCMLFVKDWRCIAHALTTGEPAAGSPQQGRAVRFGGVVARRFCGPDKRC